MEKHNKALGNDKFSRALFYKKLQKTIPTPNFQLSPPPFSARLRLFHLRLRRRADRHRRLEFLWQVL
jgi:hypothetical protein